LYSISPQSVFATDITLNARKEANAQYGVISVANTDCGLIEYNRDEETLKIIKEFEQERRELEDALNARKEANAHYGVISVANTDCGLIEYNRDEETLKIIKEFERQASLWACCTTPLILI
jgi:prephenate dehydratase